MRRNLEEQECITLLEENYIGYLSYISGNQPYTIPITYYYDKESHSLISYTSEGHKIKAMRKNTAVSLAVSEITSVANWKSVLAFGEFQELEGSNAKHMLHQFSDGIKTIIPGGSTDKAQFISDFSAKIYSTGTPIVFRINIKELTGKIRISD